MQNFCKSLTSSKHSCCDASLELGVSIHDNHQLLWYKVKGVPQFFPTANSSNSWSREASNPIYRSLLLQPSGMVLRPASLSILYLLPSIVCLSTRLLFTLSPFHPLCLSLSLSHPPLSSSTSHCLIFLGSLTPRPQEHSFYSPFLTSLTLLLFPCYSVHNLFYPAPLSNLYLCVFAPSVCPA